MVGLSSGHQPHLVRGETGTCASAGDNTRMMLEDCLVDEVSWVLWLPPLHLSGAADGVLFSRSTSPLQPGEQHLVGVRVDIHWHLSSAQLQAPWGGL